MPKNKSLNFYWFLHLVFLGNVIGFLTTIIGIFLMQLFRDVEIPLKRSVLSPITFNFSSLDSIRWCTISRWTSARWTLWTAPPVWSTTERPATAIFIWATAGSRTTIECRTASSPTHRNVLRKVTRERVPSSTCFMWSIQENFYIVYGNGCI